MPWHWASAQRYKTNLCGKVCNVENAYQPGGDLFVKGVSYNHDAFKRVTI